jgi:glycerol-3-phosphate dehydrogenase
VASRFSAETREAVLAALPRTLLDLLIIGGGITGAAVARDAALRGLTVALVEQTDWAAGTSSRSSKLIHGGVRYLEQGDVGLVREAASERLVLRRIAPHLARPLLMVIPTYSRSTHAKLALGLWTFERVATVPAGERHETWTREEALRHEPLLAPERLHGAVVFTEFLTDDARLVLDTVKGAHAAGALCVNHAEVTSVVGGEVEIRDQLGGRTVRARSRVVVNAAGPWADIVRERARTQSPPRLHLTKGIHLVVPHARLPVRQAVVMVARDRRSVFAVPRGEMTYLGSTDTDYGPPTTYPDVSGEDADYLLEAANRTFTGPALRRDEVVAAWAGLRPLLHEEGKRPQDISRRDEIMVSANGLVSIAGGKLTTHRRMAERVVDLVCRQLGVTAGPCRTDGVPLPNGDCTSEELGAMEERLRAELPPLGAAGAARMVHLHGAGCRRILARIAEHPAEAAVLPGPTPLLRAEIEHALEEEMACSLTDLLERRTRLLLFDAQQGVPAAAAAAEIAASRLGWDARRTATEIEDYRRLAARLRSFA